MGMAIAKSASGGPRIPIGSIRDGGEKERSMSEKWKIESSMRDV
jgi:hypothetical protein